MKKFALSTNIILSIFILLGDAFYITYGGLWLKGLTSALFVLLAAINLCFAFKLKLENVKFNIFLLIGLFFAMLGDIVLNIHFIGGAILFAVGHVFFLISYCFLSKLNWKDIVIGLAIFIPSLLFITLAPIFDFGGVLMEIVCVIYAFIISMMVGKSCGNFAALKNCTSLIILIGSILFYISDFMLLLNVFASLPRVVDILCLVTYYPAEILLAVSILFKYLISKNNGQKQ